MSESRLGLGNWQEYEAIRIAIEATKTPLQRLQANARTKLEAWINSGTITPSPERDAYMAANDELTKKFTALNSTLTY